MKTMNIAQYDNNNFATNPYYKSDLTAAEKTATDNKLKLLKK